MHNLRRILSCAALALAVAAPSPGHAELVFEHVLNIGAKGEANGQFSYVEDFAWSADGALLATDALNCNVQAFDKTTGKYLTQFGGKGDGSDKFEKPEGIAVDKDGNIFVADYQAGYVKKFTRSYKLLRTFSGLGAAPGQTEKSEFIDIHDGLLYVPEQGSHRVDVFDLDGKFKFLFGKQGNGPGEFLKPEAAKFNSKGMLYVVDLGNHRIQVFGKDGKFIKEWGKKGTAAGEFQRPAGLAIDKDDNVYVSEIDNNRIQVFDSEGTPLSMWGKEGSGDGEFKNLHGMIVDKTTGWLYVADSGNNRVQVFKRSVK
ncbi:MAG: 6-bladed beta-propeller [Deltaproteobacteria bacterium]|nr:6-bladed beta-propeller [Deltaproteobacteria bacterium]